VAEIQPAQQVVRTGRLVFRPLIWWGTEGPAQPGNKPLIRVNALYGAMSDLRMLWLAVTGRLPEEYRRLGLGQAAPISRAAQSQI